MQLKTLKLANTQYNLVHYYQYYDFETIGDIKRDIEKKHKDLFTTLFKDKEFFSIQFEKYKDMNLKLCDIPVHSTINYMMVADKNGTSTDPGQKSNLNRKTPHAR